MFLIQLVIGEFWSKPSCCWAGARKTQSDHNSDSRKTRISLVRKYFENAAAATAAASRTAEGGCATSLMPACLQIGPVCITPATVLAPMSGITDTVFRRFIRNLGGCGLLMTEFTSADGLLRDRRVRGRYLHFYEDEHPIAAQIFGSNPAVMADAARMIEDLGFDLVDLNLGCPAKKVVKCNGGSGLLRDLPAIRRIFEAVRAAVKIPFTVKFRMGWNQQEIVCVELARMAQECGLDAVALHARTREQGYGGQAQWEWIAHTKQAVRIPVIGNGDVRVPKDAIALVTQTGCDGVMIGRTAASNPWIFRQIAQFTATGAFDEPTENDRYQMIRTYFQMLVDHEVPGAAGKMKQFASWFTHGVRNGGTLRKAVYEAHTEAEILARVDEFFGAVSRQ